MRTVEINSDGTTDDGMALYDIDEVESLRQSLATATEQRDRLWMLLDDIDTQDDASKSDDRHFRDCVRQRQQIRHLVCNITDEEAKIAAVKNAQAISEAREIDNE